MEALGLGQEEKLLAEQLAREAVASAIQDGSEMPVEERLETMGFIIEIPKLEIATELPQPESTELKAARIAVSKAYEGESTPKQDSPGPGPDTSNQAPKGRPFFEADDDTCETCNEKDCHCI